MMPSEGPIDNPTAVENDIFSGEDATQRHVEPAASISMPIELTFGRQLTANSLAVRVWQLFTVLSGLSAPLSRLLGVHGDSTELAWVFDVLMCMAGCSFSMLPSKLAGGVDAVEKLGRTGIRMNGSRRTTLKRWRIGLAVDAVFIILVGLLTLYSAIFKVGERSKISGRIITPVYAYTVMVAFFYVLTLFCPLISNPCLYGLQYASLLVAEIIQPVTQMVAKYKPSDPEWNAEVIPAIKDLVDEYIPCVSKAFGDVVGSVTIALWITAVAYLAAYLDGSSPVVLVLLVLCAFFPFAIAATLSRASDMCDELYATINDKRGQHLGEPGWGSEMELVRLERYLARLNRGQGLGFLVFGIVSVLNILPNAPAPHCTLVSRP